MKWLFRRAVQISEAHAIKWKHILKLLYRLKMILKCGGLISPTVQAGREPLMLPAMLK